MLKIIVVIVIIVSAVIYLRSPGLQDKISYPQFPQNISQIDITGLKDTALNAFNKYLPETASQSVVLGEKAKTEGINIIIDAAKNLSPEEFKTLQQFICEPNN